MCCTSSPQHGLGTERLRLRFLSAVSSPVSLALQPPLLLLSAPYSVRASTAEIINCSYDPFLPSASSITTALLPSSLLYHKEQLRRLQPRSHRFYPSFCSTSSLSGHRREHTSTHSLHCSNNGQHGKQSAACLHTPKRRPVAETTSALTRPEPCLPTTNGAAVVQATLL